MRLSAMLVIFLLLVGSAPGLQAHASNDRTSQAHQCLSLVMYWEARGEGPRGMVAVGSVVMNRVAHADFPNSVCAVVYQGGETGGCQFSWWCDGKSDRPRDYSQWQTAARLANDVLRGRTADPTRGAIFFHAARVSSRWHRSRPRTARIGNHVFYR